MANHPTPDVDPKNLESAVEMWDSFVKIGKYATIVTCLILVGLAFLFIRFS